MSDIPFEKAMQAVQNLIDAGVGWKSRAKIHEAEIAELLRNRDALMTQFGNANSEIKRLTEELQQEKAARQIETNTIEHLTARRDELHELGCNAADRADKAERELQQEREKTARLERVETAARKYIDVDNAHQDDWENLKQALAENTEPKS